MSAERQAIRQIQAYLDGGEREHLIVAMALLDNGEPAPLQSITVARYLLDAGETYAVEYEGDPGWLEGLGLLEAAKFDLYERNQASGTDQETRND